MIFISILLNFLNVIHILQGILRTEELLFESPPTQVLLCIFCNYLFHCPYIHIKWLFCITIFGYWLSRKFIAYVPPSQKFMSDMVVNRFINPSVQKKKEIQKRNRCKGSLAVMCIYRKMSWIKQELWASAGHGFQRANSEKAHTRLPFKGSHIL